MLNDKKRKNKIVQFPVKIDKQIHVILLSTTPNGSLICRSKDVKKTAIIENDDIFISPGRVIVTFSREEALTGKRHGTKSWLFPCGIL